MTPIWTSKTSFKFKSEAYAKNYRARENSCRARSWIACNYSRNSERLHCTKRNWGRSQTTTLRSRNVKYTIWSPTWKFKGNRKLQSKNLTWGDLSRSGNLESIVSVVSICKEFLELKRNWKSWKRKWKNWSWLSSSWDHRWCKWSKVTIWRLASSKISWRVRPTFLAELKRKFDQRKKKWK